MTKQLVKYAYTLLITILFTAGLVAQGTVSGTVTDQKGNPLVGANVAVDGTASGDATDGDGRYSIDVDGSGDVSVTASYIGYESQTVSASGGEANFSLAIDALALGTINVTSQKRNMDVQKVPVAITAIDARTLEIRGADGLSEVAKLTPNLNWRTTGGMDAWDEIVIRGVGDRAVNIGYDARAGVYIDGVYAGRAASMNQSLLDIESVEVLKGPQGTMFGKNTVSGAINITTRRPTDKFRSSVKYETGDYKLSNVNAMVNVPLSGNMFAKLAVKKNKRDGYVKDIIKNSMYNDVDELAYRFQFRYKASDKLEFNLSHTKQDAKSNAITMEAIGAATPGGATSPNPFEYATNIDPRYEKDNSTTSMTVDYKMANGFALKSITSIHDEMRFIFSDQDLSPLDIATSTIHHTSENMTQELRIVSPQGGKFDYVGGLYYIKQKLNTFDKANGGSLFGPLVFAGTPLAGLTELEFEASPGQTDVQSTALFFQGNYHLSDKLTLVAGGRYTMEKKDLAFSIKNTPFPILFIDLDNYTDKFSVNVFSPRVGVNYYVNENSMAYASYAEAFKSGGWNAYFVSTTDDIGFKSEYVKTMEFGYKTTAMNNRLRMNFAYFSSKYDDFQVNQWLQAGEQTYIVISNAAKVSSSGFELEASFIPMSGLTLSAAYGKNDTKFDKFPDGGGIGVHYDGNVPIHSPPSNYNLAVDYHYTIGSFGRLNFHYDVTYKDEFYTNNNNNKDIYWVDAHSIATLGVGLQAASGKWSVNYLINNLNDELYVVSKNVSFLKFPRLHYGMPKNSKLAVQVHF